MNKNLGWYRGNTFLLWVEEIIVNKTGNADITFQELHDLNFRDLYVTGTSLNNQRLIVFSYQTYPDMKVKDAVRISMSIPLYFEAVYIDSVGHVINQNRAKDKFDIMVDGGLTANFPISIFDSTTSTMLRAAIHLGKESKPGFNVEISVPTIFITSNSSSLTTPLFGAGLQLGLRIPI